MKVNSNCFRRLLALILALSMTMSLLSANVWAADLSEEASDPSLAVQSEQMSDDASDEQSAPPAEESEEEADESAEKQSEVKSDRPAEDESEPAEEQPEEKSDQPAEDESQTEPESSGTAALEVQSEKKRAPAFEQSRTVDGVKVTVSAPKGVFPAETSLKVEKAPQKDRKAVKKAVNKVRSENENVVARYTFDIKVVDPVTGEEYQPGEGQTVSVSFSAAEVADKNLETQVYHFNEGAAEKLEVTGEKKNTATVETDGFSLYTVEFTYNNLQYVIQGDTSAALSDILAAVGLTGEATAVSVSDSSLFSAAKNDSGKWVVTAHKAFSTTEWMKVTINGVVYEIAVTDDASYYTAQFSYNGKTYSTGSITDTQEISLSSVLTTLEITGGVTAASVSEGQGMTVTTTAITLTKAFGTGWLKVTAGGTEHQITITSTPDSISVVLYGTLFFDKNGGSGIMDGQPVQEYTQTVLPDCAFTPPDGYEFDQWEINGARYNAGATYIFGQTTTAKAIWKLREGVHSITAVYNNSDGDVVVSPTMAAADKQVTVTVQPVAGKAVESISYSYGSTAGQDLSGGEGGVYTFSMPGENTTVSVTFKDAAKTPISYVDENGSSHSCNDYNYVRPADTTWSGWVVASQNMTLDSRVTVSGTVNLILMDGKTLTVTNGIQVGEGSTLNIYAQSGNTGALIAGNKQLASFTAGIGGDKDNCDAGTITINGGKITAVGGYGGAGIGGGTNWGSKYGKAGSIAIRGNADVTVTGGENGAGIGSSYMGKGGSIAISGNATVYANAVDGYGGSGAAIGGGRGGYVDSITISGGTVVATGGNQGSAIGGTGGTISITGGNVTATATGSSGAGIGGQCTSITIGGSAVVNATGASYGAGIGGFYQKAVGNITIEGNANVTATGGDGGAGIGTGREATGEATITITGGTVNASMSASNGAAAIGSGYGAKGKTTVSISGGQVTASGSTVYGVGIGGGNTGTASEEIIVNISGGTVTATGRAGIGTANASEATQTITISGGTVIASGTIDSGNKAAAIGQGNRSKSPTTINITGGNITANGSGNGIGAGANTNKTPTIKLRWTGTDDKFTAISYVGNVTLEKAFKNMSNESEVFAAGALTDNSVIADKTLIPTDTDKFAVIISDISYGGITPDPRTQTAGQTVTLTIQPVNGSTMNAGSLSVTYTDGSGTHTVSTTQDSTDSNKYTFTMPAADVTVTATFTSAWQNLQNQINANNKNIKLTGNVVACDGEPALQVPADKTAVIDLNGHKIDRNLSYGIKAGYVMEVRGTLTIKDSSSGQNGKITGGNHKGSSPSTYGGGILVEAQGKLTLESGSITRNTSEHFGGGVCLKSHAEFYMSGGSITGNTSMYGAGIAARDNSTLSISGGTISGNTASYNGFGNGGGVYFDVDANFIMTGGEIKNNTAARDSGGIHYASREKFKFGGSATVTDNTVGGKAYNVRIPDGKTLTIESALTGTIGVTTVTAPTEDAPVLLTSGLSGKGTTTNFTSDKATYAVDVNTSGEAVLKLPDHIHNFTYSATGATIKATCANSDGNCPLPNKQAALTINAPTSLTYDGTAKAATVTGDTGVLGTPTIAYKQDATALDAAPVHAGTYTASITLGTGDNNTATASVSYTIAQKSVTITGVTAGDKVYDGTTTATAADGAIDGKVGSDDVSFIAGSAVFDNADVGSRTVTFSDYTLSGTAAGNYALSAQPVSVTANITAQDITVTAANQTVALNGAIATGTDKVSVTSGSLVSGHSITAVSLTGSDTANATTSGTITLSAVTIKNGDADVTANYNVTFVNGVLTVNKADPTVTAPMGISGLKYTGAAQDLVSAGSTTGGALKYAVTTENSAPSSGYDTTIPTGTDAGKYYVWYRVDGNDNYNDVAAAGPIEVTIGQAPLTVTAKAKTITYGEAPANDGVEYSGFVNGETEAVLTGTLAYDYSCAQYDDVGSAYTITPGGLTSGNYEITFANGTLTVEPKEVGLDWSTAALTFDGQPKAPGATATGTVNNDVIGVTVTVAGEHTNAGDNYTATASALTGDKAGNYRLPTANTATFSIGKATAQSIADVTQSLVYTATSVSASVAGKMPENAGTLTYAAGTADNTGGVSVSNFEVDASSGSVSVTLSGGASGNTITLPVTIGSTNYADSTVNVIVTLTDKTEAGVSISPDGAQTKSYGDAAFTLTASITDAGTGTGTWTWTSSNESVATVTTGAESTTVTVKAASSTPVTLTAKYESDTTIGTADIMLTVNPKSVAIPAAVTGLKWTGTEQTGVAAGDGYTVADGAKTDVGSYTATATLTSTTNYQWSDSTTAAKTITWSIAKADGPAAPTAAAVNCTTTDNNDGKLTGVTTAMEYKKSNATDWTAGTGSDITGLVPGTYYVRLKATDTSLASDNQELTIAGYVAPTYKVTYKVVNGTWSDDSTADKKETVQSGSKPASVPTGMKASSGYTGGAWDTDPADATITGATTFTYTFTAKQAAIVKKAPTAKTLTYNGSAQELVTAGEAEGGTMYYAVTTENTAPMDDNLYTTSIPTKTNAGSYYVWYKVKADANHSDTEAKSVSVTIRAPAPTGGGTTPTTETITIPVSSEDGKTSVNVTVTVSGSTATVTSADVDKVLGAKDVGNVTVDVTNLNKVDEVVLPAELVEKVAKAVANQNNDASGLEIKLPTGTVTFDATTVAALAQQSNGKDLKVHLDKVSQATLTNAQQTAIKDLNALVVLDAYVTADGKRISNFNGGKATFSVPVELKNGQVPEGVVAFFVDEKGNLSEIPCTCDDKNATGTVTHFSNYVVAYDVAKAEKATEDAKAVEDTVKTLDALPAADNVKLDDKEAIEKARAAYDALTDEQKAKVDPAALKKLTDAEAALKALNPEPQPEPGKVSYDDLTDAEKQQADEIASAWNVDKDTAAQMLRLADELGVSLDTLLLTGDALAKMDVDSSDPKGTDFGKLRARVTKRTNSALTLKWAKQKNADGYLIYGNQCGKGNKLKLIKTIKKNKTVSFTQKKLKKGTYYKYMVVAYKNVNGQKMPIAASVVLHAPTKGGNVTVAKSVKVTQGKKNKAVSKLTLKKGKSVTVKATEVKEEKKLKLKTHRVVKFESSNKKIATVNAKGKVTGKKKGKATIYAYAQNGTFAKITVTVK